MRLFKDNEVFLQDGMGMRYAFMGPMETIHLNAEGTQNYCDRYGEVSSKYQLLKTMLVCIFQINNSQIQIKSTKCTNTKYKKTVIEDRLILRQYTMCPLIWVQSLRAGNRRRRKIRLR